MQRHSASFYNTLKHNNYRNDEFRADKLLERLQSNPVSEDLVFTKVDPGRHGAMTFWLLCSKKVSLTNALSGAYYLGNTDKCSDAAQILRSGILNAYKNNKELPWPPTADDMELNA